MAARVLLNYDAADLTLEGAFLAGLIAGPYTGAIVGLSMSLPALAAGEYGAPFFAVGCGFAGGGLREACPKEDIWSFSPFVIFSLPRYVWRMLRDMKVNWQVMLLLAPVGLELIRQMVGARYPLRLFHLSSPMPWLTLFVYIADDRHGVDADQDLEQRAHRASPAGTGEAAARREGRSAQEPDQSALPLQHADVGVVADPIAARNRARGDPETLRPAAQADAEPGAVRHAARGARGDRRVSRHRGDPVRLAPVGEEVDRAGYTGRRSCPACCCSRWSRTASSTASRARSAPAPSPSAAAASGDLAIIEVEDDGLGISDERLPQALSSGIGLSNVNERLRVLYGASGRLALTGSPGRGACARVEIPLGARAETKESPHDHTAR